MNRKRANVLERWSYCVCRRGDIRGSCSVVASAGWQQSAQAEARCKRGAVVARGGLGAAGRSIVHPAPAAEGLVRRAGSGGGALPGKALSRVQREAPTPS